MKTNVRNAVLLVAVAICASARAGEFKSLRGFSLTYPDGWAAISSEQRDAITQELKPWLDKLGKVDLTRMAAVFVNPKDDGFLENINVVVAPGAPGVDAAGQQEYRELLANQLSELGVETRNLEVDQATFGGKPALTARLNLVIPGEAEPVREWQVAIPGRGQTYIVTCSARASEFSQYEPLFQKTIDSLKIDAGPGGLWYSLSPPVRFAIIGGLIGLLVGIFRSVFG